MIASVSFGATRCFMMRRMQGVPYTDSWQPSASHEKVRFSLADGSLLVMRGATQRHWEHCVSSEDSSTGARINITFRRALDMPESLPSLKTEMAISTQAEDGGEPDHCEKSLTYDQTGQAGRAVESFIKPLAPDPAREIEAQLRGEEAMLLIKLLAKSEAEVELDLQMQKATEVVRAAEAARWNVAVERAKAAGGLESTVAEAQAASITHKRLAFDK